MARLTHRTHPQCTYFVTTKSWENRHIFRVVESAEIVVAKILAYRAQGAYSLHEFVLMPNHLHLLLTPGPETALERAIQLIKGGSSYAIHKQRGNQMKIWQPGFHDWTVRDAKDYQTKVEYIRTNPVEAGLVNQPIEWVYGSASGRFKMDGPPAYFRG